LETLNKDKNPLNSLQKVLSIGYKVLVLLLFVFLFVGGINPARISEYNKRNVSLAKSAFYFQTLASDLVDGASQKKSKSDDENLVEESDSYDDFYASFEAMIANSEAFTSESTVTDDEDLFSSDAKKIKPKAFSKTWESFSEVHTEIADAFNIAHIGSVFTVFAVLYTLLGVFLSFGTGLLKRIGYIIVCTGSFFVALSMIVFAVAYGNLCMAQDLFFDAKPIEPQGIPVFVITSILIFAIGISLLFLDKIPAGEKSTLSEKPFQYTYRIVALLIFVLLFIPGANPARISTEISRTVSLFTSAFSYNIYTKNIERAFIRGWLPEYVMRIANLSSLLVVLGVLACGFGSCISVGNNKLKRIAHFALGGGELVAFVSLFGIKYAYNLVCANPSIEKVPPLEPACFNLYLILLAIMMVCTAVSFIKTPAPEKDEKCHIDAPFQLFLMLLPFLILVFLFSYLPLWGWRYAFFDYTPGDTLSMDKWVGLKWFRAPFESVATRNDILRVLRNTLVMSGIGILFSWLPMIFAIFLAEIKNTGARKVIQTLTTVPNFISWVLVYAIAFCIFGTDGFISSMMVKAGLWDQGKNMLMGDKLIWLKMWAWGTWKGLGWSAIMYIAAISGIDQQLYEAATVDGAGRFQKIWNITIPELLPTYLVLLILSVSNILSNGMDQYLVFKNPTNQGPIEVLDLYVYNLSFGKVTNSNIPFSTVVSMLKSVVSVVLLFITNKVSKLIRGSSIF